MIPIHLSLSGFLSYREPVEIDFTLFDLACIAGPNGAGKSSLLDAITWALFGQARRRDDALIHTQSAAAEVGLVFSYEGNTYYVQRTKPREKTMLLEFHILQAVGEQAGGLKAGSLVLPAGSWRSMAGSWKPLTERTLRETEARIQQTLRMDYETFINASFFLQGRADQFTQQRAGDRKRILGTILGLEVWETYRARAAERRKAVEAEIRSLDGRLQEIMAELAEEEARKQRLEELEGDLARLEGERAQQEKIVQSARQFAAALQEQQKLVDALARQWQAEAQRLQEAERLLQARQQEKDELAERLARADEIEAAYAAWQAQRRELEQLEKSAAQFWEQERQRQALRAEMGDIRARLEQERVMLWEQHLQAAADQSQAQELGQQAEALRAEIARLEGLITRRAGLDAEIQASRQGQADAKAENQRLKTEMDELKERIDRLEMTEGAECPLCGQPLGPQERQDLIDRLKTQGKEMGDRYRANTVMVQQGDEQVRALEDEYAALSQVEVELRARTGSLGELDSSLRNLETAQLDWTRRGLPRLDEVEATLAGETYAPEARARLVEIDEALQQIGYDTVAHDAARQAEEEGRASEAELRELEKARATLAPLEREIVGLRSQIAGQQAEVDRQQKDHLAAAEALETSMAQAPDLAEAERALFALQERENRLRMDVGAARQKVAVLESQKTRRKALETEREAFARQVQQYKQLERAFSKDGVPALLIEQALPEIESKANEILARLSEGGMSVRFATQAAYKDKARDDLRETLDILISDGAGVRDYEMFSGGEAFRVNFAIRLALSKVLAQRAGARLQTLVIDEGFGSQDALGRQRLVEAINLVASDFAKILVISHIDELKDAFPNRIEVEKTSMGSIARVV
jgi:exonuclease SbcC